MAGNFLKKVNVHFVFFFEIIISPSEVAPVKARDVAVLPGHAERAGRDRPGREAA